MKVDKADEKTSGLAAGSAPASLLQRLPCSVDCVSGSDVSYVVKETLNVFGRIRRGRWFFARGVLLWSSCLSNSSDKRRGFRIEFVAGRAGDCID